MIQMKILQTMYEQKKIELKAKIMLNHIGQHWVSYARGKVTTLLVTAIAKC